MFEDKIILDDTSFKALSSESRVNILKNLNTRRMTLSELSKKLNLENSTIKEHCNLLVKADLIKQIDEGRKWKYYELTNKGKNIIQPNLVEQIKVLIVLCFGVFIFGGILTLLIQPTTNSELITSGENTSLLTQSSIMSDNYSTKETQPTTSINERLIEEKTVNNLGNSQENISREFFITSVTLSMIVGLIIGWVFSKKYY